MSSKGKWLEKELNRVHKRWHDTDRAYVIRNEPPMRSVRGRMLAAAPAPPDWLVMKCRVVPHVIDGTGEVKDVGFATSYLVEAKETNDNTLAFRRITATQAAAFDRAARVGVKGVVIGAWMDLERVGGPLVRIFSWSYIGHLWHMWADSDTAKASVRWDDPRGHTLPNNLDYLDLLDHM